VTPLGGYRPEIGLYIFGKLFSRATFSLLVVWLYLEPFKSTEKFTTILNYTELQKCNMVDAPEGYHPVPDI